MTPTPVTGTTMTAQLAYRRGWDRSRFYDDSIEDFDKCRARFEKKWGTWVFAWEQGWLDAAGSGGL
jgi:hypothetical protein